MAWRDPSAVLANKQGKAAIRKFCCKPNDAHDVVAPLSTKMPSVPAQSLSFRVYGNPATQGSARAFVNKKTGRAIVTSDNTKLKPWRKLVTAAAIIAMRAEGWTMADHAVSMEMEFILPRLKSHPTTGKGKPPIMNRGLDLDKLERAVNDSCGDAGIFVDDSRIVEHRTRKRWAEIGEAPGAIVTVRIV
jgi:Holliday junction resolvase RusA-like endonuclease